MHVGLVLRRIKLHYHPDAVSYSSVMRNLHGPVAENVTKAVIFVNWFLCAAYCQFVVQSFDHPVQSTDRSLIQIWCR